MSLVVVGVDYPNQRGPARRFEIAMCSPGEPVELRLEPKNPADPLAVAVFSCRGIQLGYLTAERCGRIGAIIRSGTEVRAIFQEPLRAGAAIRVAFGGQAPEVPTRQAKELDRDPEFWPEDLPPDHDWGV